MELNLNRFEDYIQKFPQDLILSMKELEGDGKYHKENLYTHLQLVFDLLSKETDDTDLLLCAIFHDIGKLKAKLFLKEKNKTVFYGHEYKSLEMFEEYKHLFEIKDEEKIKYIISQHMRVHKYNNGTIKKEYKRKELEEHKYFSELLLFSKADEQGRINDL
jgi:putative nucleotidyltransferase with HDIG domain